MRRIAIVIILVLGTFGVAATATYSKEEAKPGLTPAELTAVGWDCILPDPSIPGLDVVHCAPPGGLASLPDAPALTFIAFDTTDPESADAPLLGVELIIRGDLFRGEPCPADAPGEYTYLGPLLGIDYWACHSYDSPF